MRHAPALCFAALFACATPGAKSAPLTASSLPASPPPERAAPSVRPDPTNDLTQLLALTPKSDPDYPALLLRYSDLLSEQTSDANARLLAIQEKLAQSGSDQK